MNPLRISRFASKTRKVFWITFSWTLISLGLFFLQFSALYFYECTSPTYDFTTMLQASVIAAFIAGLVGGPLLVGWVEDWLRTKPYGRALFYIVLSYSFISLFVGLIASFFYASYQFDKSLFDPLVYSEVYKYMTGIHYMNNYVVWLIVLLLTIIVMMVNDKYGPGVFRDFLLGKYFHPTREERIFMFLDLRNSTTIAETLGEEKYFDFIKEVFKDATPGIIASRGEIYQYVGDEIIVSWKMDRGTKNANCIRSFFEVQTTLRRQTSSYKKKFGVSPEFKAGLHYGYVMAGELGVVKRDISFSGDVLNTTARIQGKCNELGVNILFSKHLLDKLSLSISAFQPKEIGSMLLRGKQQEMVLYTVEG